MSDISARPAYGSATVAVSILSERMPWGGPRFHPPGEHPATYRMREHRRAILDLLNKYPLSALTCPDAYRNACEALAYIEEQLAAFEAGEDQAKQIAWARLRDRL